MADHGEEDVGGLGEVGGGGGEGGALGLEEEGVWVGRVAGVEGESVAGGEEARGHGGAHHADADEADAGFGWVDSGRVWRSRHRGWWLVILLRREWRLECE